MHTHVKVVPVKAPLRLVARSALPLLALAGWPLIRSAETWEQRHNWSDAGQPEGLAYKIEIFEAVDRRRGFDVRTPRIPGLLYSGLEEKALGDAEERSTAEAYAHQPDSPEVAFDPAAWEPK